LSGFLVTRNPAAERRFIARRGPDRERTLGVEGYRFSHYLVDVAGRHTSQPFVDGDVVCVFDGEIYDTSSAGNDPAILTSLYRRHGDGFAQHLDGDFAVALYDFGRRILVLATDPFGTKPLFRRGTEAASYASGLGEAERIPPNTIIVVDLDRSDTQILAGIPFDFDHQEKGYYDDWIAAFEGAVRKRAADGCYLPLSAGYDSGGIACALRRLDLPCKTYSVEGEENLSLLAERGRGGDILRMDAAELAAWKTFLRVHCERAAYRVLRDGVPHECDMLEDNATGGLARIHSMARAEGRAVFLSGQGGDEILDARRAWPGYRFPERLQPWPDFSAGFQAAYLTKEEFVAGVFGAEGRYPYLDRAVVQEFLWLGVALKNRHYKAPLHEYMTRCGYPFERGMKTGFCPFPPGEKAWPWTKASAG
jgi:asparagine synthetase B (glutamine-hydrolysing)